MRRPEDNPAGAASSLRKLPLRTIRTMVSFANIKSIAAALPEVDVSTSYGTPAFKVRSKLMARLKEDSETLVVRVEWQERERLLASHPQTFFLTEHYRDHPWVLLRLKSISLTQAKASLLHAWQQTAPASLKRATAAK